MTAAQGADEADVDTVDRLIAAAIEALETSGESGFRVDRIIEASGASASSLYHHFGSRDGLIDAARAVEFTRGAAEDVSSIDFTGELTRDSLLAELDRINRVLSAADREPQRKQRLAILGRAATRPALWATLEREQGRVIDDLSDIIVLAQSVDLIRPDVEPRALAVYMLGHGLGRVISDLDPEPADLESRMQVVDLVVRTFVVPPDASA